MMQQKKNEKEKKKTCSGYSCYSSSSLSSLSLSLLLSLPLPHTLHPFQDRISKYKIKEFTPPLGAPSSRKLLVLDVDYTLFDHRSSVETPLELMR
jgi:hypothetical protein